LVKGLNRKSEKRIERKKKQHKKGDAGRARNEAWDAITLHKKAAV
jgi:hypothetical protein